jgi:hypothetical protein
MVHWDYYKDNTTPGPYRICHLKTAGMYTHDTTYEAAWRCCGKHEELSHRRITKAIQEGTQRCRECAANDAAGRPRGTPVVAKRPYKPDHPERRADQGPPAGARDLDGHWWPMLGHMGPRGGHGGAYVAR